MRQFTVRIAGLSFLTLCLALAGCSSTGSSDDPKTAGTFTDSRDGTIYKWTKIGTQVWMAENLNFGTRVDGSEEQKDATASSAEKYCFDDNESNCDTFGGLYQWHSAMALPYGCNESECADQIDSPHRGICPAGWHVPTQAEWAILDAWVDENNDEEVDDDAGISLKSVSGWAGNGNGTDAYGWAGLPGGDRYGESFNNQSLFGYWWSASESDAINAWYRLLVDDSDYLYESTDFKSFVGFSVRCVKDAS